MAVRIYSLAKELKVDSKELVDICAKVGIRGKGSALASLDDDEVAKLRDHFSNPQAKASTTTAAPAAVAPERPTGPVKTGKMPVINASRPVSPLASLRKTRLASQEKSEESSKSEAKEEAADKTADPVSTPADSDDKSRSPGPLAGVMRREEYVSPGNVTGKMRTLDDRSSASKSSKSNGGGATQRSRPAIKLAPIPAVDQP
ncbi:MAG: translation initiation factor IF-2 N-terminal domain-containing protein, partial [Pirellulales bacterium]|nr:translation initiation factor IF-2 N-terminal domain-containing protein [Pirellulales bacterium]